MFAARGEALLHYYRKLRVIKLSITELRQYSKEWNEWKRSDERTLFLLRNERRLVDVYTERCHVPDIIPFRAVLTTGATLLIGFVALKGAKC